MVNIEIKENVAIVTPDRPIADGTCCAGEIGLSGEVRPAPRTERGGATCPLTG